MTESIESINYLFKLLKNNNIAYWLDAGTILKGIRDGDFLNSTDIDLAVKWQDHQKVLQLTNQLKDYGCEIIVQSSLPFLEDLYTIILPEPINRITSIDIYIYHPFGDNYVRRSIHKPCNDHFAKYLYSIGKRLLVKEKYEGGISRLAYILPFRLRYWIGRLVWALYDYFGKTNWYVVPGKFFSEFTTVKIYDISFPVPKYTEEYLQYRYGENWKTPVKREHWFDNWKKGETKFIQPRQLSQFKNCERYWLY